MLTKPSQYKNKKAQSAMEYLMTYGWAILIIAVVLGALFSLGVFSGSSLLGSACIASSGYYCQSPIYSHTNGNIIVSLGQNTGTTWITSNFVFVPQGTAIVSGLPSVTWNAFPANTLYGSTANNGLISGQQVQNLYLPDTGPVSAGVATTGTIWVQYTTSSGVPQYAQIAAVNVKAT